MDVETLWSELVRGELTVEDWFDEDGLRVVVVRRVERNESGSSTRAAGPLSPRERLVLARVAAGHSNKRIAYDLGLTVSSVASYIARAASKLRATSRIDLVRAHCEMRTGTDCP